MDLRVKGGCEKCEGRRVRTVLSIFYLLVVGSISPKH